MGVWGKTLSWIFNGIQRLDYGKIPIKYNPQKINQKSQNETPPRESSESRIFIDRFIACHQLPKNLSDS